MAASRSLFWCLIGLNLVAFTSCSFFYPNAQASLLEHLLVDTHGNHASGFANAITPCSNYVSGSQNFGRTTAAQWLRVSFHDFITANVTAGTGGIDASIGFETSREENSGSAMNDSLGFFRPWMTAKIGMADLIALSVAMSVGNCGGVPISVRGGRVDATQEGVTHGVPAPETELNLTLTFFSRAGFNLADSIALTACGHTMGSVHHGGFPTVVGTEAVTDTNTAGGIHFDSTVDVFDTLVLGEYLNGTGNRGGPLVTSFNVSSRSDLRLYEADNNATIIELYQKGQSFLNTCSTLFQRMIETVPRGVILSDVVKPMPLKPINATLDFDTSGNLIFSGLIRTLTPLVNSPPSLQLAIAGGTPITLLAETALGTSVFGTSTFFPFSLPVPHSALFFGFAIKSSVSNSVFPTQPLTFVVRSMTSVTKSSTSIVNFTVAVIGSTNIAPIVELKAPVGQQGTLAPIVKKFGKVAVTYAGTKAGYQLWSGTVDFGAAVTGPIQVAVLGLRGEEIDISFF